MSNTIARFFGIGQTIVPPSRRGGTWFDGPRAAYPDQRASSERTVVMRQSRQLILIMLDSSGSMETLIEKARAGADRLVERVLPVSDKVLVEVVAWSDSPSRVAGPVKPNLLDIPEIETGGSTMSNAAAAYALGRAVEEGEKAALSRVRPLPTIVVWISDFRFTDRISDSGRAIADAEMSGKIESWALRYGSADEEKHREWMATVAPDPSRRFLDGVNSDFGSFFEAVGDSSFSTVSEGRAFSGIPLA